MLFRSERFSRGDGGVIVILGDRAMSPSLLGHDNDEFISNVEFGGKKLQNQDVTSVSFFLRRLTYNIPLQITNSSL